MDSQILIIDDDKGTVKIISILLERNGIQSDATFSIKDGLSRINEQDYDVVLLDVNLPDGNGLDNIHHILDRPFPPQVIIMTGFSNPDGAQLAIESGAWDYLPKPISKKDLQLQISRALQYQEQKRQTISHTRFKAPDIIGESQALNICLEQSSQIISSDGNVLITGATGTGKELFARAIHQNSARRNGEFVVVDCSVLSESLTESVLFGHRKGAFTGAEKDRKGLASLANGGTLFLDEVGELPESIQASFLRVLQEKTFRPVGSEKEVYSDFRVICATNQDLEKMATRKTFRTDLLYRLKTFVLKLPPLKDRNGDISLIASHQVKKCCDAHRVDNKTISPDFMDVLEKYDWPGNVRELINTIETCVTTAQFEETLFAVHLPVAIRAQITFSKIKNTGPRREKNALQISVPSSLPHKEMMEQMEKTYLKSLFSSTSGDIRELIQVTGLSRTVLYRKLKKHDIK